MKIIWKMGLARYVALVSVLSLLQCSIVNSLLGQEEESNTSLLSAMAALLLVSGSSSGSSSVSSYCGSSSVVDTGVGLGVESVTGPNSCWTNADTAANAAGAPNWIKNNFRGMTITDGGTTWNFAINNTKANGRPPHKSGYYSDAACKDDFPSGNSANPNSIGSANLNVTFQIPKTPGSGGGTVTKNRAGVTVNGITIFNDEAAPGDSLATELATMDQGYGHPQNTGNYHYHTEPCKISRNDSSLVGIAADGYAIYGRYDADGSTPTLDSKNFHAGSTNPTDGVSGHYHVESASMNLLIRTNFTGTAGTITN